MEQIIKLLLLSVICFWGCKQRINPNTPIAPISTQQPLVDTAKQLPVHDDDITQHNILAMYPDSSNVSISDFFASIHIEFEYVDINGIRKTQKLEGFGEDPADGYYKPQKYDIVITLKEKENLSKYIINLLIMEYIYPYNLQVTKNLGITQGWIPVELVHSDIASAFYTDEKIIIKNPKYLLVGNHHSGLYSRGAIKLVALCHPLAEQEKIDYIEKIYEYPQ